MNTKTSVNQSQNYYNKTTFPNEIYINNVKLQKGDIVAVDFDMTIAITDYPKIIKPIYRIINLIKKFKRMGIVVILYTCREGKELDNALAWCEKQGIVFNYINRNAPERVVKWGDCRKIGADLYIDDRAVNPNYLNTHK